MCPFRVKTCAAPVPSGCTSRNRAGTPASAPKIWVTGSIESRIGLIVDGAVVALRYKQVIRHHYNELAEGGPNSWGWDRYSGRCPCCRGTWVWLVRRNIARVARRGTSKTVKAGPVSFLVAFPGGSGRLDYY